MIACYKIPNSYNSIKVSYHIPLTIIYEIKKAVPSKNCTLIQQLTPVKSNAEIQK